ncbi:hypothetical protein [Agarilytica rhodophyticola]|uniref:hypothetical protein n=1 Tax=Agarilytica rhodophyticola TaxID=1737490 RepID=UPI00131A0014|nr:hypothetical protein [Agarilytica rhodophyticola]
MAFCQENMLRIYSISDSGSFNVQSEQDNTTPQFCIVAEGYINDVYINTFGQLTSN